MRLMVGRATHENGKLAWHRYVPQKPLTQEERKLLKEREYLEYLAEYGGDEGEEGEEGAEGDEMDEEALERKKLEENDPDGESEGSAGI